MNIFVLDLDVKKCAEYLCDKHLIKQITEHNQILGSVAYSARGIFKKKNITAEFINEIFSDFPRRKNGQTHPYGIGYVHHPCTKWAGESAANYQWLCELNIAMCKEYTKRYHKVHKGEAITNWYSENRPKLIGYGMTKFAQAMPNDVKDPDAVKAYRQYYIKHKSYMAKWSRSETPSWYLNGLEKLN